MQRLIAVGNKMYHPFFFSWYYWSRHRLPHLYSFLCLMALLGLLGVDRWRPDWTAPLRVGLTDLTAPMMSHMADHYQALYHVADGIHTLITMMDSYQHLQERFAQFEHMSRHYQQLMIENESLKKILHVIDLPAHHHDMSVTARIIADVSTAHMRSAIIYAGSDHHVTTNHVVMNHEGLVGRVLEVGVHSARILLITDQQSRVPVLTSHRHERAIIAGDNSDYLHLRYVRDPSHIQVGEWLTTSGDGGIFPPGLLVGRVISVSEDDILVEPAMKWNTLEYVWVASYHVTT